MANPFFNALGGAAMGNLNPMTMMAQLRQNPLALLQKAGFNVPAGMNLSNPQAIVQHLMNSGQITQDQLTKAQQMAQQFGIR